MTDLPESFKDKMSLGDFFKLSTEDRSQVSASDDAKPWTRHFVRLMGRNGTAKYRYTIDDAIPPVLCITAILPAAIVIKEHYGFSFLVGSLSVVSAMLLALLYYFVANVIWIRSAGYRYNWWTRKAHKTPDHKAAK